MSVENPSLIAIVSVNGETNVFAQNDKAQLLEEVTNRLMVAARKFPKKDLINAVKIYEIGRNLDFQDLLPEDGSLK